MALVVSLDARPARAAGGAAVEEVVVTAQKRAQNLQAVPISVDAFSTAFLDKVGAQTVADLQKFTPGLTVDDSSTTQPKFAIRGIQTDDFGIGTDPAVGIFVDGVYAARSGAALIFLNDVERVEVLKGPQGTLFGRNTTAGAISIIANKPNDTLSFKVHTRLGDYGKVLAEATANIPVGQDLAFRFNAVINRRDGYVTNTFNGQDAGRENNNSFRSALRWHPREATDILLVWDHDDTDKDGPMAIGLGPASPSRANPFADKLAADVVDSHERRKLDGVALTLNQGVGPVKVTAISAYKFFATTNRESETGTVGKATYYDTDNREKNRSFYQELRGNAEIGPVNLTAGGSYYYETGTQVNGGLAYTDSIDTTLANLGVLGGARFFQPFADAGAPVLGLPWLEDMHNQAKTMSWAAFADATWAVTPKLNLSGGLRFTRDAKTFRWLKDPATVPGASKVVLPGAVYNGFLDAIGAPEFPASALIDFDTFRKAVLGVDLINTTAGVYTGRTFARQASWTNTSPRLVVDYHWTDEVMTYVSAAQGYKAGGFDAVRLNSYFRPEKVTNIEGGFKSELAERTLRLNASAYHYRYKDRQQLTFVQLCGTCLPQYDTISGDNEATGFDVEARWFTSANLSFTLNGGWVDAIWAKRTEQSQLTGRPLDLAGQPTGEPNTRLVAGVDYAQDLRAGWGGIQVHADHSYTTARRLNTATRDADAALAGLVDFSKLGHYRGAQNYTNLRLTWTAPGDDLDLSFYVENLFDNRYLSEINTITAFTLGTPYTRISTPRFMGVDLTYKW